VAAEPSHVQRKTRADIVSGIQLLDRLGTKHEEEQQLQRRRQWDSQTLIQLFRVACMLKDMSHVSLVIRCLRSTTLLSAGLRQPTAGMVGAGADQDSAKEAGVPGKSTIKRMAFHIDVAAMLLEKRKKESRQNQLAYYGWADASPQGHREWLLAQTDSLGHDGNSAWSAMHAAHSLMNYKAEAAEAGDCDSEEDDDDEDLESADRGAAAEAGIYHVRGVRAGLFLMRFIYFLIGSVVNSLCFAGACRNNQEAQILAAVALPSPSSHGT
jgi:hypothetical protein